MTVGDRFEDAVSSLQRIADALDPPRPNVLLALERIADALEDMAELMRADVESSKEGSDG